MNPKYLSDDLEYQTKTIKIYPTNVLNINVRLESFQQELLVKMLEKISNFFACNYTDVKGISPNFCTHNIYIKEDS